MGSAFEFVLLAPEGRSEGLIEMCIDEVKRIEYLLTEFSGTSQTALLNRLSGIEPVDVEPEVYAILKRSSAISGITQGAFDITASLLKKLYNFRNEKFSMPDNERIRKALEKVGYEKIKFLGDNKVYLAEPGMHIGFGAIGKGYAADRVKQLMIDHGVYNGVINASGDLTAWGCKGDGRPWTIGIADPANPAQAILRIPVNNAAVATSGDYEQYFELNGERYSHTIDPKNGLPVKGIKSVTVVSASAELADALATAVFIMGANVGIHFIEQLPNTYALLINDHNEILMSGNFKPESREPLVA
jgi:FAD:protein FMN transferase